MQPFKDALCYAIFILFSSRHLNFYSWCPHWPVSYLKVSHKFQIWEFSRFVFLCWLLTHLFAKFFCFFSLCQPYDFYCHYFCCWNIKAIIETIGKWIELCFNKTLCAKFSELDSAFECDLPGPDVDRKHVYFQSFNIYWDRFVIHDCYILENVSCVLETNVYSVFLSRIVYVR